MHSTTIPITLQLNISLPEGVTLAPQVLTESNAWQYTAAPIGGDNPCSVDLRAREPESAEVRSLETPDHAAPESEERNTDLPHASHSSLSLRAHPSESKTKLTAPTSDPLGSIISEQNVASSDAERKAELEQFLASIPDVLPASANIHDRDLQFLGKLLRGQLNEDLERRSAKKNGRAAKNESAPDVSRGAAPGSATHQDAAPPAASDDATHASVETNATNTPSVDSKATSARSANGKAASAPAAYDTRGSVLGRLFNAHERLRAEVRELRDELARTQAALVANVPRGAHATRTMGFDPRQQPAATQTPPTPDTTVKTDAKSKAANAQFVKSKPTSAKHNDDPYDVPIAQQSVFTHDGVELPPHKRHAAILLIQGASFAEAGRKVGVSRQTVWLWKRDNPEFNAVYNMYRNELRERTEATLFSSVDLAAKNFVAQIEAHNFRASEKLLKGFGFLNGKPVEHSSESAAAIAVESTGRESAPRLAEPRLGARLHERNGHVKLEA